MFRPELPRADEGSAPSAPGPSRFPRLGVGVGLRPSHAELFSKQRPTGIDWVEVITENHLPWEGRAPGRYSQDLERIRSVSPIALHGVSMSLGSIDPLNRDYLKRLRALADAIEPAWISDHLCWTGVDGQNLHELLPLPYTREAVSHVAGRIRQAQDALGRRMLVENLSSYLELEASEMTEWEFLNEVAREADCGILLDVNNIYVSSVNHGFDPLQYLEAIPADRVGEIHLAGHSQRDGYLLDTHDGPVCEEVWDLYRKAFARFGDVSAMIEWDSNLPEWDVLSAEAGKIRKAQERVKTR